MPVGSYLTSANASQTWSLLPLYLVGKMSTRVTANKTTPTLSVLAFFNATTELIPLSSESTMEKSDSLPIIIALICIFFILATCLIFVTFCKPVTLDQSCYESHECMPYHPEGVNEPQLRLWKRLGSLRHSIHSSVKRSRPVSQTQETCSRKAPVNPNWSIMESTEMWFSPFFHDSAVEISSVQ